MQAKRPFDKLIGTRGAPTLTRLCARIPASLRLLPLAVIAASAHAFAQSSCTYTLSTNSLNVPVVGSTSYITVTTGPACQWTATSSDTSWLTVLAPSSGAGNGIVNYTAGRYRGYLAQSATLTVAGQNVTVNQPSACGDYTPLSDYYLVDASGTFYINPGWVEILFYENAGCSPPPVTSNSSWISAMPGNCGCALVNIGVNTGPARAGSISVGTQTINFYHQYAGNLPIPTPPYFTFSLASNLPTYGGNGTQVEGGQLMDLQNGAQDLVYWKFYEDQWTPQPMTALQNDGTGAFSDNTAYLLGSPQPMTISITASKVADFNKDGLPDLFLAAAGPDTPPFPRRAVPPFPPELEPPTG